MEKRSPKGAAAKPPLPWEVRPKAALPFSSKKSSKEGSGTSRLGGGASRRPLLRTFRPLSQKSVTSFRPWFRIRGNPSPEVPESTLIDIGIPLCRELRRHKPRFHSPNLLDGCMQGSTNNETGGVWQAEAAPYAAKYCCVRFPERRTNFSERLCSTELDQ